MKTTPADGNLRLVIYGRGSTAHRPSTLLRLDESLREDLDEVAQGPLYLIVEHALRKLLEELKARPADARIECINAETLLAKPSRVPHAGRRAPRPRKARQGES